MEMIHDADNGGVTPWNVSLTQLQKQYPDAVHLLKNAHTI
jgi:hypothetical protein